MVLHQPNTLREWSKIEQGLSSRLLRLEGFRALDRLRCVSDVTGEIIAECRSRLFQYLKKIGLVPLTERVLARAEQSMPTVVGSLDSIHLVSALYWREQHGTDLIFATHDTQLALAANAHGFKVIGV
ncbi:MAG: hypothetical protein HYV03_04630 [Deltaproteobacteria bacterium]|nr:hypothetical protein [Deltaproteobacteria bacterium]